MPVLPGTISAAAQDHVLSDTPADLSIVHCFGGWGDPAERKANLQFLLIFPARCGCCVALVEVLK